MVRIFKATALIGLAAFLWAGCRPETQAPAPGRPKEISSQQQEMLQQILEHLERSGSTLEALVSETERRETVEGAPADTAALGDDVTVAKGLVSAVRRGVTAKSAERTQAALQRLAPALMLLRSRVPAATIAQHLERGLTAISTYSEDEAKHAAAACLRQAAEVAVGGPARLMPDIMEEIDSARAEVDRGNLSSGADEMLPILKKLSKDESIALLDRAVGEVASLEQAVRREAWPVAAASLDQLDSLLGELQQHVAGEMRPLAAERATVLKPQRSTQQ